MSPEGEKYKSETIVTALARLEGRFPSIGEGKANRSAAHQAADRMRSKWQTSGYPDLDLQYLERIGEDVMRINGVLPEKDGKTDVDYKIAVEEVAVLLRDAVHDATHNKAWGLQTQTQHTGAEEFVLTLMRTDANRRGRKQEFRVTIQPVPQPEVK